MRRPPLDSLRRNGPWGLLGMLVLVALAEGFVARHDVDFTTIWVSAWSRSGKLARGEAARSDVLCLGDSLVKYGVVPRVLEKQLGLSVYNLAVFNGQAPSSYFLLRRALDAGARPSALIFDGETLEEDPRVHERRWMEMLEPREVWDLAWAARDARLFGSVLCGRYLASLRARHEIRVNLMAAFRGESASGRYIVPVHWRNWNKNRGAHVEPTEPSAAGRGEEIARSGYLPADWSCHPTNAVYVRKFMRLAAEQGIPVFWVLPPLHPDVHERRERGGLHGHFLRFVRAVRDRYPGLVVIDGRDARYDPAALVDLTHLNARGSSVFSAEVGEVVRDRLARGVLSGPRWVKLPAFRDRPADAPLEDLRQSATALRDAGVGRARR